MFQLGFTMEELLFPENYPSNFLLSDESNFLLDKFGKSPSTLDYQEHVIINDDDLYTLKQLNHETGSNNQNYEFSLINDQTLPIFDIFSDNYHCEDTKPMAEIDCATGALILPNLTIQFIREKNQPSFGSDTIQNVSLSSSYCDQRLLTPNNVTTIRQSNKHMTSKSTSSLSFGTQSSTSMTSSSSSIDEISSNSNDYNDAASFHHSAEFMEDYTHNRSHQSQRDPRENSMNTSARRRRKRTIFTAADIEQLKEAFIQNPKPTQQDIAILSEQLGHDSYVIRVWFYNKRQATKKTEQVKQY